MAMLGIKIIRNEGDLQAACIQIFTLSYPHLWDSKRLYAIPNGGLRNKVVAAQLKRQGQVPGVWDCFLSIPVGEQSGLYIELKWGKNVLTKEQKKFREGNKAHYAFAVCYTQAAFLDAIAKYLQGRGGDVFQS